MTTIFANDCRATHDAPFADAIGPFTRLPRDHDDHVPVKLVARLAGCKDRVVRYWRARCHAPTDAQASRLCAGLPIRVALAYARRIVTDRFRVVVNRLTLRDVDYNANDRRDTGDLRLADVDLARCAAEVAAATHRALADERVTREEAEEIARAVDACDVALAKKQDLLAHLATGA